jgi:hypothetical protein
MSTVSSHLSPTDGGIVATTLRLPEDLERKLSSYCTEVGATKNRLIAIALPAYLDDSLPPRPALSPRYPAVISGVLSLRGAHAAERDRRRRRGRGHPAQAIRQAARRLGVDATVRRRGRGH